jgi:hypothetical protein
VHSKRAGRVWLTHNPASEEKPGTYIIVEINKAEQGKGIGQTAFLRAAEISNKPLIYGVTRKSNVGSIKAMERAGYTQAGTTKSGELLYEWHRSVITRVLDRESAFLSEAVDLSDHRIEEQQSLVTLLLREDHGISTDRSAVSTVARLFQTDSSAISQIRALHHANGRTIMFSLVHSWALVGASYHAWRTGRIPRQVVHVDDHTDFGACIMDDSSTPPTGRGGVPYILEEPATIIENLFRGSFNKGSYLTAFLALTDVRGVQQVCWSNKRTGTFVFPSKISDHVFCAKYADTGATPFRAGVCVEPWEDADDPVWLDIDLDAFCNRFNGDSDRRDLRANVSERQQFNQRIEETVELIRRHESLKNAELVTIAASPGFCPSGYWEEATCRMLEAVESTWTPF